MNRRTLSTLLSAMALTAAAALGPAQAQGLADFGSGATDSKFPLPAGSKVFRDVSYGADGDQRIDVYAPENASAAPVLFMVHGGGWMIGDKAYSNVVANKLSHWLPKGFVLISVDYRLSPKADPLEQAKDVAKALAFAQSKAATWGADPARFILMGHSSGAHLVSLLAADPDLAKQQGASPWLGSVALDSAALDVVQIMQGHHMRFYDRVFKSDPAFWRDVSPALRLKPATGPMFMVCSSRRSDSCPQAHSFVDKVNAAGGHAVVYPVDLSHGELNQKLGLPGAYTDAVDAFVRSVGLP